MKRTLTLKRESLAELSGAELGSVNGGQAATVVNTACVDQCVYTRIDIRRCYAHTAFDCLTRFCD